MACVEHRPERVENNEEGEVESNEGGCSGDDCLYNRHAWDVNHVSMMGVLSMAAFVIGL